MDADLSQAIADQVRAAHQAGTPLRIVGGDSKPGLGRPVHGEALELSSQRGIVSHVPTELVITARAGTPLTEIETALAEQDQQLAFEPPHLGANATLGGTVACNLSGPARPYAGAARDFVLGARIVNGRGEILRFGGEVMKNVAGYDLARLMAGAQGTLGVLLELSLKVLPRPAESLTLTFELEPAAALARFNAWAGQALPITAACHDGERAYVRLAGAEAAVRVAREKLGGEGLTGDAATGFWRAVRERQHAFFEPAGTLWRLSLPPAAPYDPRLGRQLIDWGGALRWVPGDADLFEAAHAVGGHAIAYDGTAGSRLPAQAPALAALQRRLKTAFDPAGILNPGRLGD